MKYRKPISSEYPVYYFPFIKIVEQEDAIIAMHMVQAETQAILGQLSNEQGDYRYDDGKWTIKEIIGHLVDAERVFQYRSMCLSRGENKSLPGFDQDLYAVNSNASTRSLESLLHEFNLVRQSSIALFSSFTEEMLNAVGNANGYDISVRAISFILPGHERHHLNVIKEKYLSKT